MLDTRSCLGLVWAAVNDMSEGTTTLTQKQIEEAARIFLSRAGRKGGSQTSDAKKKAARRNGMKGARINRQLAKQNKKKGR